MSGVYYICPSCGADNAEADGMIECHACGAEYGTDADTVEFADCPICGEGMICSGEDCIQCENCGNVFDVEREDDDEDGDDWMGEYSCSSDRERAAEIDDPYTMALLGEDD